MLPCISWDSGCLLENNKTALLPTRYRCMTLGDSVKMCLCPLQVVALAQWGNEVLESESNTLFITAPTTSATERSISDSSEFEISSFCFGA